MGFIVREIDGNTTIAPILEGNVWKHVLLIVGDVSAEPNTTTSGSVIGDTTDCTIKSRPRFLLAFTQSLIKISLTKVSHLTAGPTLN